MYIYMYIYMCGICTYKNNILCIHHTYSMYTVQFIYICMYMYVCTCTYIHVHIYKLYILTIYIVHTHTHTHTHTHITSFSLNKRPYSVFNNIFCVSASFKASLNLTNSSI